MSKEIKDISKDKQLEEKCKNINLLQEQFQKNPSPKLAEQIIQGFNELLVAPQGYRVSVNTLNIKEKITEYTHYLENRH